MWEGGIDDTIPNEKTVDDVRTTRGNVITYRQPQTVAVFSYNIVCEIIITMRIPELMSYGIWYTVYYRPVRMCHVDSKQKLSWRDEYRIYIRLIEYSEICDLGKDLYRNNN